MKSVVLFSSLLLSLPLAAQIAHSYNFSGKQPTSSGTYMEKHPAENSYYTASLKESDNPAIALTEISLTKLNDQGQTQWYQKTSFDTNLGTNGIGDIAVSASNVFISALIDPLAPHAQLLIMKYDHAGNFIDSNYIGLNEDLQRAKSELKIDSDGNLVTTLKGYSNDVHFIKIDPTNLSVLTDLVIGNSNYTLPDAHRWHCIQIIGTSTIVAYNALNSVEFVELNSGGVIVNSFSISSPDGAMTDLEYHNSILCILINKHFASSSALDNPLRTLLTDLTGATLGNVAVPVQHAVVFESFAFDSDDNTYVVSRNQGSSGRGGTILKIDPTAAIDYEQPMYRADMTEIQLEGSNIVICGNSTDQVNEYELVANGQIFISYKTSTTPEFEVVAPHMLFHANNITCQAAFDDNDFSDYSSPSDSSYLVAGAGTTVYSTALLLAAEDINGQLEAHYGHYMSTCAAGPITNLTDYTQVEKDKWQRVWKVSRAQIDAHIQAFSAGDPSYHIPEAILHWPGNGDPAKGQHAQLARYMDLNGNGIYEPALGEYPLILGDQCVLSIYNDMNADMDLLFSSAATKLGAEILEYLYAFDCPTDSALQNTLFLHYEIHRTAPISLYNTYVGHFVDIDINNAMNDYVSTDPVRGISYTRDADATGPEQAYLILGSTMDEDDLDNSAGIGSNSTPNGFGYGDGIIDNERLGMTNALFYNNSGGANGEPSNPGDYYRYLQSIWLNGSPVTYGGDGFSTGTTTLASNFMFQGDSDPIWYSTQGVDPGFLWTEELCGNAPGDRRGIAASGPFILQPFDTLYFDVAFVTGMQSVTGGYSSHEAMIANVDSVRSYYTQGAVSCGTDFGYYTPFDGTYPYLDTEPFTGSSLAVYPNPTNGVLTIQGLPVNATLYLYSATGQLLSIQPVNGTSLACDYSYLEDGIYFITVTSEGSSGSIKFVKQ